MEKQKNFLEIELNYNFGFKVTLKSSVSRLREPNLKRLSLYKSNDFIPKLTINVSLIYEVKGHN